MKCSTCDSFPLIMSHICTITFIAKLYLYILLVVLDKGYIRNVVPPPSTALLYYLLACGLHFTTYPQQGDVNFYCLSIIHNKTQSPHQHNVCSYHNIIPYFEQDNGSLQTHCAFILNVKVNLQVQMVCLAGYTLKHTLNRTLNL